MKNTTTTLKQTLRPGIALTQTPKIALVLNPIPPSPLAVNTSLVFTLRIILTLYNSNRRTQVLSSTDEETQHNTVKSSVEVKNSTSATGADLTPMKDGQIESDEPTLFNSSETPHQQPEDLYTTAQINRFL